MAAKVEHDYLSIVSNGKSCQIKVKDDVEKDLANLLEDFIKARLKYDKTKKCYVLTPKGLDSFIEEVNEYTQDWEDEDGDKSSSDDEEETMTIQTALARRIKLKSRQDVIEDETISDSEHEDIITSTRRIRFLLRELKQLKQRVADLERK